METSIERSFFNLAAKTILQLPSLLDDHILIPRVARHEVVMRDEPRGVFVDQNQTPELDWLACLAPFVKLRVRLEKMVLQEL